MLGNALQGGVDGKTVATAGRVEEIQHRDRFMDPDKGYPPRGGYRRRPWPDAPRQRSCPSKAEAERP